MAKDILQQTGSRTSDAVIVIPESVKKSLPRDFNIGEIGKIDLSEAERIASEDILLIKESDLVEGLEDFDIIPLEGEEEAEEAPVIRKPKIKKSVRIAEPEAEVVEPEEIEEEREAALEPAEEKKGPAGRDFDYDDGRKWITLEELEKYDEHGRKWTPLEELVSEAAGVAEGKAGFMLPKQAPLMVDGYVESDDEYVIWDVPGSEKGAEKKESAPAGGREKKGSGDETAAAEVESVKSGKESQQGEDEVVISMEDLETVAGGSGKGGIDLAPLEYSDTLQKSAISVDAGAAAESFKKERIPKQYREMMSAGILGGSRETGKVNFIDDREKGGALEEKSIFSGSELDRIISGIGQVEEGQAFVMREANVDEDRERIAVISADFGPSHEDLFVDLDYKYSDEELDYIHSAIVEEDYSGYIREIDEFFGIPGGRTIPAAVELLGLTADEFDTIEDMLFKDELKGLDRFDRYHLYEFDRSAREGGARDRKAFRYLLPEENSLLDYERDSIESDVSSSSALIFEEDIHDITEQLVRRSGKTEDEIRRIVERTFGSESLEEQRTVGEKEAADEAAEARTEAGADGVYDITDRVVILDNQADVDRFVREFPPGKQMNIKTLLKYLDGLFETLPEEIIKKFASSEYFELYLKVLNELGV